MDFYFYILIVLSNLGLMYGQINYDSNNAHREQHYPHYPPLVYVNNDNNINHEDGKHVGVHIPNIYNMDLHRDPHQGLGMGINVLNGLVRINLQRNRDLFSGKKSGPISVEVAGVPVFNKFQ